MTEIFNASWFAEKMGDRSARGIALETRALIRSGLLPIGVRLPAIRDLAYELGVSPTTISEAWSELRRQKIITGRGRNGSWVTGERFSVKPERTASFGRYRPDALDLSLAVPDSAFLPPLQEAMVYGAGIGELNSYQRSIIIPELRREVEKRWPYDAEAFLATNGGYNAVYTALRGLVPTGSLVAVENPTAGRILDILDDLDATILPVECDHAGPKPGALKEALSRKPAAFLFQPRMHSVTGHTVSEARFDELAQVLGGSDTLIIEDDGIADISRFAPMSLGRRFPDRTIHILSYSKTFGPDLRLAVLSSSKDIVDRLQSFRSFSAGWTSRILQGAVAFLLQKQETWDMVTKAREAYAGRSRALLEQLSSRGLNLETREGLCLWIPVASESFAMVTLAAQNIAVVPGEKFSLLPSSHIRVATSNLKSGYNAVAEAIALAQSP